jgi:hypothetical protein
MREAERYIRRIRNTNKREYARAYLDFVIAHPVTYLDEFGPDYECGGMAAQAVRWEIWAICKRI